jgi:tetratricopeptide (TPR) repeat protein
MLHGVSVTERQQSEWQLLENDLFARYDALQDRRRTGRMRRAFPALPAAAVLRPVMAAIILALVCVAGLGILRTAPALLARNTARIIRVEGAAWLDNSGAREPIHPSAAAHRPECGGRTLETGAGGSLVIELDQGTGIFLEEQSRIKITRASSRGVHLLLEKGSLVASVARREKDNPFVVKTTNGACSVLGTVFRVAATSGQPAATHLSVYRGAVRLSPHHKDGITVQTGKSAILAGNQFQDAQPIAESQTPVSTISQLTLSLEHADSAGFALLDISSEPNGAEVFINDRTAGKTPLVLAQQTGVVDVRIRKEGYRDYRERRALDSGSITGISAMLNADRKTITPVKRGKPSPAPRLAGKPRAVEAPPVMERPEYVEALLQMNVGEYRKALRMLDSLRGLPELAPEDRMAVLNRISQCYQGLGDFDRKLEILEERYRTAELRRARGAALWEIATIQANCLADYAAAMKSLHRYRRLFPEGPWASEALIRLGELQLAHRMTEQAAETYQQYLASYSDGVHRDRVLYELARIFHHRLNEPDRAIPLYRELTQRYPQSPHAGDALYWMAECLARQGDTAEATAAYRTYLSRYAEGQWHEQCSARLADSRWAER